MAWPEKCEAAAPIASAGRKPRVDRRRGQLRLKDLLGSHFIHVNPSPKGSTSFKTTLLTWGCRSISHLSQTLLQTNKQTISLIAVLLTPDSILCSGLLINASGLVQMPCCFCYYGLRYDLMSDIMIPTALFFLLCLLQRLVPGPMWICGFFFFFFSFTAKNTIGILVKIALNCSIAFGGMAVFNRLILLTHDYGKSLTIYYGLFFFFFFTCV